MSAGAWWTVALVGASLSGCAQQPVRTASSAYHGHEYFAEAKYGHASPRMVADGQPVPRGGGQYLVGHPYTIAGHTYYPSENPNYSAVGLASWYGSAFHGRRTANGEVYDMRSLSAAHPTMPLPSYARVTNLTNGYSVIVRVNDRGPYHGGRVMDVSSRAADVLDFKGSGTARIKVDYVGPAPMEGSDDNELLASLRTDGSPASINGGSSFFPVMVATQQAPEPPPPAPVRLIAPTPTAPPPRAPEPEPSVADVEPTRVRMVHPPVPPSRPFDLGAIHRSEGPLAAVARAPMPPKPPVRMSSNDRALYFTPPPKTLLVARSSDPLAALLSRTSAHSLSSEDR